MSLIKSISGFRGTIGGKAGDNLTPIDVVKFTSAYATWLKKQTVKSKYKVVIGRDARISGQMISQLVSSTLQGLGIDVIDLGLSTTPTVEVMVTHLKVDGGIILTASHNPKEWNALKLLNSRGEFLSANDGTEILEYVDKDEYIFAEVNDIGTYENLDNGIDIHIDKILELPIVNIEAIKNKRFKVVIDAVNSTGGIAIPKLLERLGVEYYGIHCDPNGCFPHNPEPLKEHLGDICKKVVEQKADLGIVVDPDVDRLALIDENGEMFGEEYTLVAIADFILSKTPSATVSNLSSSRALRDVTEKYDEIYSPSAVGEVNVVTEMKRLNSRIGGEGNGGIIYPELHYGRDSLVGIALFLNHLAEKNIPVSELRASYPSYFMAKKKIKLTPDIDVNDLLIKIQELYKKEKINTIDGVKIDFSNEWVHLRKSNTEPIIRIYTESTSDRKANTLADKMIESIKSIL